MAKAKPPAAQPAAQPPSRLVLPPPPGVLGALEFNRVNHTRLRRRLLYSEHEQDLVDRVRLNIGNVRESAWGNVDLTANPYETMWHGAAALYDEEPEIICPNPELVERVADAGYFAQQQRVQRDTLALREMFVRVEADADGLLMLRPVFPDMVSAWAHPRRPDIPIRLMEASWSDEVGGWIRYDLDISNPEKPSYRVITASGEAKDVTEQVLGGIYDDGDYPYRDGQGVPFIPYGGFHAAKTGNLFDPYTHREIVEGSLNIGVLLTFYRHLVTNAAWAQRYAVNLEPIGLDIVGPDGQKSTRREIVTDPATLLLLRRVDGAAEGQIGQWSSPGDPEAVLRSIGMYERRILSLAGFTPPDVTRQEADIRSGYSLAVDREALRARQRVFEPQFRRGDQQVLWMAACILNRTIGTDYSENAAEYRPVYRGLPRTPAEVRLHLEEVKAKRDAGMIGPVTAYLELHPERSYDEAVVALAQAATENADVEQATKDLLSTRGISAAPAAVSLEVGKVATAAEILVKAQAGELPVDTAKAMMVSLLGLTDAAADAMTRPLQPPPRAAATPGGTAP